MTKWLHLLTPLFLLPPDKVEAICHVDQPLQWPHGWGLSRHKRWQECLICPYHLSVHVLQSTWCTRPAQFLCCAHVCRFCFIFYGLRFYAQSHSDDCQAHTPAPCSARALAQARPTMSYIPLINVVSVRLIQLTLWSCKVPRFLA